MDNKESIRINKFLSKCGVASRREAEELIKQNRVKINDKIAILGQQVFNNDIVKLDNNIINIVEEKIYYLMNKPKKTVCTLKDNFNRQIITDLIDDDNYLFPVGRLDYDTTGAILITNDGELANKLSHPSMQIKRVYRARLDSPLNNKEIMFLNSNNVLVNGKSSKQDVVQIENRSYLITITQGSYHHIKKLFEVVNKKVIDLKRVEFAGLTCEKLPIGSYRKLKLNEIKMLKKLTS